MTRLLITGGIKSGKSSYALQRAAQLEGRKQFLATAIPFDNEMKERIIRHQEERGPDYLTMEEPVDIHRHTGDNLILDCVTVWMNNLFYNKREEDWKMILSDFLTANSKNIIVVTNEVGLGNIPLKQETRKYNEYLAAANKFLADSLDEVIFMVSGIPLQIKGYTPETSGDM
jgi:adenosylcobinamide kinase / adenosylcobinamide-phosphate guanylyltransferase